MSEHAMQNREDVSNRLACEAFRISQGGYRYVARSDAEHEEIACWRLRLTGTHCTWGLCFLYWRNVKGVGWSYKRVYRICRKLELNLRTNYVNDWFGICSRRNNRHDAWNIRPAGHIDVCNINIQDESMSDPQ